MKTFILLVFLFLLSFCSSLKKTDHYKYAQARSSFPHEFSDHFPSDLTNLEITGLHFITPEESDSANIPHLFFTYNADSIHIVELEERIRNSNLSSFNPHDTTLIVIGDTINYLHRQNGVPIPSFKNLVVIGDRLSKDYLVYIYDAKPGKYLRTENLTNNSKLPLHWRNGYTKGLAINQNEHKVIFWMSIW